MKALLFVILFALAVAIIGRAIDHEVDVPESAGAQPPKPTYQGKPAEWWARRAVQARKDANARGRTIARLRTELERHTITGISPTLAIRIAFGSRSDEALHVAWCESRYSTGAVNGQYRGLFQMGTTERATYGHGWDPLTQAQAARRYFDASGRDWSPWDPRCRP